MNRKEKFFFASSIFFLVSALLPLPLFVKVCGAVSVVLAALFCSSIIEKWHAFKTRPHVVCMLLFFAWLVVSLVLSENKDKAWRWLDPRLALAYFPLTVGTLTISKALREAVLKAWAWSITAICTACFVYALQRSHFFERPEFLYNDALTQLIDVQSIYMALLVNIAIFVFTYFILFQKSIHRGWMATAIFFLLVISYFLASRIMLMLLVLVIVFFAAYYIIKRKKYLEGATLVMGLIIGGFLVLKFFPQTLNRFKELTYTDYRFQNEGLESHYNMAVDSTQWNGANFRRAAWACGWQLFKQHPFVGVGLGDKRDALFKVYTEKGFQFALRTRKNVHSNYLDILYSTGIIGFVLFALGWIVLPLRRAWQWHDRLSILIIATFAAAWVTEIYFDRMWGGMLSGFLIPFLLASHNKNTQ